MLVYHSLSNWNLEMLVLRGGENHCTGRKTCRSKGENQQQIQCSSSFNGDDADDDDDDDDNDGDDKNSCRK